MHSVHCTPQAAAGSLRRAATMAEKEGGASLEHRTCWSEREVWHGQADRSRSEHEFANAPQARIPISKKRSFQRNLTAKKIRRNSPNHSAILASLGPRIIQVCLLSGALLEAVWRDVETRRHGTVTDCSVGGCANPANLKV